MQSCKHQQSPAGLLLSHPMSGTAGVSQEAASIAWGPSSLGGFWLATVAVFIEDFLKQGQEKLLLKWTLPVRLECMQIS